MYLGRSAIELEKKGYAENYEQGQAMEKNLIATAREVEKLRAEIANAEKRAQLASTVNSGPLLFDGSLSFIEDWLHIAIRV